MQTHKKLPQPPIEKLAAAINKHLVPAVMKKMKIDNEPITQETKGA